MFKQKTHLPGEKSIPQYVFSNEVNKKRTVTNTGDLLFGKIEQSNHQIKQV